jgi:hypothetical protein
MQSVSQAAGSSTTAQLQHFVPKAGMENDSDWGIREEPSDLNPTGWVVLAHLTLGGKAAFTLPGGTNRCRLTLLKGDDRAVTIEVRDDAKNSTMTFDLVRDRPAKMTVNGRGYRLLFPTTHVNSDAPDTTHKAFIIVKPAEDAVKKSTEGARFGPVIERALGVDEEARRFLNLETGLTLAKPREPFIDNPSEFVNWLKNNGVNAELTMIEGNVVLRFHDLHAYPEPKQRGIERWDQLTAEEFFRMSEGSGLAMLPFEANFSYSLKPDELPLTLAMSGYGLLQVTAVSTNSPRRATIRYKLLQSVPGDGKTSTKQ